MSLTPQLCRMARAGLGMSNSDLAAAAGVGVNTISRFEQGGGARQSSVLAIRAALEAAGATFLADKEVSILGGPGVRLTLAE